MHGEPAQVRAVGVYQIDVRRAIAIAEKGDRRAIRRRRRLPIVAMKRGEALLVAIDLGVAVATRHVHDRLADRGGSEIALRIVRELRDAAVEIDAKEIA